MHYHFVAEMKHFTTNIIVSGETIEEALKHAKLAGWNVVRCTGVEQYAEAIGPEIESYEHYCFRLELEP